MCAKIISIEQAIEMKNEYQTRIKTVIEASRGSGYQATEFVWIDLETLKNYLKKLDDVKEKNSTDVSGIRIYFSAYPKDETDAFKSSEIDYPDRETLFLAPTIEVASTSASNNYPNLQHLPFCINPTNASDPLKGAIEIIDGLLNVNDNTSSATTSNYTNKTSLLLDKMTITPPPY